jgi:hypothetical protein
MHREIQAIASIVFTSLAMPLWDDVTRLIDENQVYVLEHHPCVPTLLSAGITCAPALAGPVSKRVYRDPTLAQYAVITGQLEVLKALLAISERAGVAFADIFDPPDGNTKHSLLALAALEDRRAIAAFLVDRILALPGDGAALIEAANARGETALRLAADLHRPEVAQAIVRGLPDQGVRLMVALLLGAPALVGAMVDGADPRAPPPWLEQMRTRMWDRRTLEPTDAPGAVPFSAAVAERAAAAAVYAVLAKIDPRFAEAQTVTLPRQAPPPPPPASVCCAAGCEMAGDLRRCQTCDRWFCAEHGEDHRHD